MTVSRRSKKFKVVLISATCALLFIGYWHSSFLRALQVPYVRAPSVQKQRVLIVSYFRSGTTFFSRLLGQHPDAFYHYEPIYMISGDTVPRTEKEKQRSLILLRHLLRCDFETVSELASANRLKWLEHYVRFNDDVTWPFNTSRVHFLPKHALVRNISEMCTQHKFQVVKIVRLALSRIEPLLKEFPDLKVIYLVRDPRPMYKSRANLTWCADHPVCIDPRLFCGTMKKDLEYLEVLKKQFPERVKALRFEDFVLDLNARAEEAFRFLNFEYAASRNVLEMWLRNHSQAKGPNDYYEFSIVKNDSKSKAYEWKTTITEEEISYVEEACADVINILSSPFT